MVRGNKSALEIEKRRMIEYKKGSKDKELVVVGIQKVEGEE